MRAAVFAVMLQQSAAVIVALMQGISIRTAPEPPPQESTTPRPACGHPHCVDQPKGLVVLVCVKGVLQAANGILDLALDLIDAAFGLELFITGDLSSGFLDVAAQIFGGTVNAIIVGHGTLLMHTSPD